MEEIKRILHEGNYSCVIKNAYGIHTYTQRGVADLYDLYTQKPEYLKDASIADKVIGKGAAALRCPFLPIETINTTACVNRCIR